MGNYINYSQTKKDLSSAKELEQYDCDLDEKIIYFGSKLFYKLEREKNLNNSQQKINNIVKSKEFEMKLLSINDKIKKD